MKITQEDYTKLNELCNEVLNKTCYTKQDYIDKNLSMMRYRWDIFNSIPLTMDNRTFLGRLYNYLNDDNIDSALRKITDTKLL